ncbi:deoxyribose-phosphate aldolase [Lacinutrix neustonica]|uniref:Deoxyribose-phosphate aldolase n=1 Tax=Lacinutrix neustonica TaxID=2980107 RepID=A0A9E8SEA0_9FLAO|nr:DUF6503 family protein [Lacinutrix neustonica]WAC02089.1 deoxyribose-phosphate aldolase [Lacinutrix neustonica]
MKRNHALILLLTLVMISCRNSEEKQLTAEEIINKAIVVSGGEKIENATIDFTFRDKTYKAFRNLGRFELERVFLEDTDTIRDVLNNTTFKRYINSKKVVVSDSTTKLYSNAVNSVHYFSLLPYGLNAKAVNKTLLDTVTVLNKKYYKIRVTFDKENGGDDFDDVFVYWINTRTFKMDYLAYAYAVNGGGQRFRAAFNERFIEGIRFVDYNNYKPLNKDVKLESLERVYEAGELELLSKIVLENIRVTH